MRVLLLDDVAVHRAALADLLRSQPAITGVSTAADPGAALRLLTAVGGPSVVLVSMTMRDGLRALRQIGRAAPAVALAVHDEDDDVIACAEAGAAGFLLRDQPLTELVALLESVSRGETRCSPRITATLLRHVTLLTANRSAAPSAARLTPREREVLELIDEGLSNKQIARRLCIELRTVKNHVHHILEKYEVHRRTDAAERFRAAARV